MGNRSTQPARAYTYERDHSVIEESEIVSQLREIREVLARLEEVLRQIAVGLGVNPHERGI